MIWKVRLLLLLLGSVVGGVIAEIVLIVAGISHPLPYRPDEHCGTGLRPGFNGWWSKEGAAEIQINSAGFRDREHTFAKPDDVIRVAVLGDSYIEAFQVDQSAMFGTILEKELNRLGFGRGQRVEVLSFGVSGYGTAQELLLLRHHVWLFDPDFVLLAFLPANDLRNNSPALEDQNSRPFFRLVDGELALDNSFRGQPAYQYAHSSSFELKTNLINSSRILQLARAIHTGEFFNHQGQRSLQLDPNSSRDRIGLDDRCFAPPANPDWTEAWKLAERLIEAMHREVAARDCQFAVTVVTSGIQVSPDARRRQEFLDQLGVKNFSYADARIQRLGERLGFPVIPLSKGLRKYAQENDTFVHGFSNTAPGEGHWNEHGHREAARICAEELVRILVAE